MRILITNDDGVNAGQLVNLIRWCRQLGDVTAIVPKFEQSGKSHSIELHRDLEVKQMELAPDVTVWTMDSSPADCVRFAVLGLKMEIDLVISGINRGLNIGTDVMYSGTCGAAFEAVALGIPAIALSTAPGYYEKAIDHLDTIKSYIISRNLMQYCSIYNINIPSDPKGIKITHQGGPYYSDDFTCVDENMYRPIGICVFRDSHDDTLDTDATLHGYITITPLTIIRTDMEVYRKLQDLV